MAISAASLPAPQESVQAADLHRRQRSDLPLHVVETGAGNRVDHQPSQSDPVERRDTLADFPDDHGVVQTVRVLNGYGCMDDCMEAFTTILDPTTQVKVLGGGRTTRKWEPHKCGGGGDQWDVGRWSDHAGARSVVGPRELGLVVGPLG